MINASSAFLRAMSSHIVELNWRFDFFDYQYNFIEQFTKKVSKNDIGNLSIDLNRPIRRSFSFTLDNKNGEFTFNENSLIWLDKIVKLYVGLKTSDGTFEYVPQGVFYLSDISNTHNFDGKKTTISAQDKMARYTDKKGTFKNQLTVQTGVNCAVAIKLIANDETMFNFDTITATVPYELTFEAGSSKYEAMNQLAQLAQCEPIHYDENGYLRLRKLDLNAISSYPAVWSYKYNDPSERFYAGNVRSLDASEISNHIIVLGGSGQTAVARYELVVDENDPLWADSPYSVQKIGDYLYGHNNFNPDGLLTTNDECKYRAKYTLMQKLGYSERLSLSVSPMWLMNSGDVIEIIDDENSVNGRYLVESINMPLQPQLMTMECRKERKVIDNWDFI